MEDNRKEGQLPEELVAALRDNPEVAQMKHNWAYSFMPVTEYDGDFGNRNPKSEIYLVGYCKVCDNSVAALVEHDRSSAVVTRANVPKWGCVPVD